MVRSQWQLTAGVRIAEAQGCALHALPKTAAAAIYLSGEALRRAALGGTFGKYGAYTRHWRDSALWASALDSCQGMARWQPSG